MNSQSITRQATRALDLARATQRDAVRLQYSETVKHLPGDPDEHLTFLASLTPKQREFYLKQMQRHTDLLRSGGALTVKSSGEADPNRRLDAMVAAELEKTGGTDRFAAARRVMAEHPGLAFRAKQASEIWGGEE